MTIFLSFLQSDKKHPIPGYSFWQYYIKNGIEEAGHQWVECPGVDWALGLVPKSKAEQLQWKANAWGKTTAWLKKHPVDIFLSYLYPHQIDVSALCEIKKLGIPCVNFFCDNIRDFKKIPFEFGLFDLNWVPEFKALDMYKAANYPHIHLPMPIWIAPQYRQLLPEANSNATFIGSKEKQRHIFFEDVVAQQPNLPLAIYGEGWAADYQHPTLGAKLKLKKKLKFQYDLISGQGITAYLRKLQQRGYTREISNALQAKAHGAVTFDEYNQLTAQSMVTIGVNRYTSYQYPLLKPNSYSRLRDIEAPMLGACYLTEWTPGIDSLYEIGTEIETYKNTDDFIEKIKVLQNNPQQRRLLKLNGQKRALNDHHIGKSLQSIFQKLLR